MKILIICHDFPSEKTPVAISFRIFQIIKILKEKYGHDISVISFQFKEEDILITKKYCKNLKIIKLPSSMQKRYFLYLFNYLKNIFTGYISLKKKNLLDFSFSYSMQKEINEVLTNEKIDIIFADNFSMVPYIANVKKKKILTEIGNTPEIFESAYNLEENLLKKLLIKIQLFNANNYEKDYSKFDSCVVTTSQVKDMLKSKFPDLKIKVIPFGVNIKSIDEKKESNRSLLFFGTLSSVFNQKSALNLYYNIFKPLQLKFPNLKLYIVGMNPPKELLEIGEKDKSVIITGYVDDLLTYLELATLVVLPIHGFGIKTRLIEAMSAGKAVIISPEGVRGVKVTDGQNVIIAENNDDFIANSIKLIKNKELRTNIGNNAKDLMYREYSWEKIASEINDLSIDIIENN